MVELRLLGPLSLSSSDGRGVTTLARQPKRAALLAYLAAAVPHGLHRRETLLAMFWPESDQPHARQALSQTLHVLRRALGDQAIVTRGDEEVGVNPEALWCDVPAFESALDQERTAEALTLYRGAFLEGLAASASVEFDHWMDGERERLKERASEAAWSLAALKASEGDQVEAERWARKAVALVPADEVAVRRLMNFLASLGDAAAAYRAYETFSSRLAEDTDLQPSLETQALAAAVRTAGATSAPRPAPRPSSAMSPAISGTGVSAPRMDRRWSGISKRTVPLAIAAAAAAFLVLAQTLFQHGRSHSASPSQPPRIMVLPFENLGPPGDAYFVDGITDEITARLAMVREMEVIAGQTSAHYKGSTLTPRQIAREVNIDYLLEGTVTREQSAGGKVRVRVRPQLIDARTETQVWAVVLDEDMTQLFPLLSEMAQQVVSELHVALEEPERSGLVAPPTQNLVAYDYYLQGRQFKQRSWTEENTKAAIAMLERAIQSDTTFALAYAWLSYAHTDAYWLWGLGNDHLARAKEAADNALRLAPQLADAEMALGFYYYACCEDYPRALTYLEAARSARPGDAFTTMFIGDAYKRSGRWDEAVHAYDQAAKLDPRWAGPLLNLAQVQLWLRHYGEAEQTIKRTQLLQPGDAFAYSMLTWISLLRSGNVAEARALQREAQPVTEGYEDMKVWFDLDLVDHDFRGALDRVRRKNRLKAVDENDQWLASNHIRRAVAYRLLGDSALAREQYDSASEELQRDLALAFPSSHTDRNWFRSGLAISYAGLGRRAAALEEVRQVLASAPREMDAISGAVTLQNLAFAYVLLGERTEAIKLLTRLLAVPAPLSPALLRVDPLWEPLRSEPAFERLLQ